MDFDHYLSLLGSPPAIWGATAALGVVLVPVFTDFKLPFKLDKFYKKVLYIFFALLIGAFCESEYESLDLITVIGVCVGWPKLAISILQSAMAYQKAHEEQLSDKLNPTK